MRFTKGTLGSLFFFATVVFEIRLAVTSLTLLCSKITGSQWYISNEPQFFSCGAAIYSYFSANLCSPMLDLTVNCDIQKKAKMSNYETSLKASLENLSHR